MPRPWPVRLPIGLTALLLAACAQTGPAPEEISGGILISNVTVVDTRDGTLLGAQAIHIDGGRIRRIAPAVALRAGSGVQTVDGSGKFVVPGFLDMHTHAMVAADRSPNYWPLLIANGVTGVREMAGSPELIQRARALNEQSQAGLVMAPEVLMIPGRVVAGLAPTPAAVAAVVQQNKADGADFIKLVGASRPATLALLAEAKVQGLTVAGHLPLGVPALEASAAGLRTIEHYGAGLGILLDCAGEEERIRTALLSGEGAKPPPGPLFVLTPMLFRELDAPFYRRALDSYSDAKCRNLARSFVQHETWQVPTLIRLKAMQRSDDPVFSSAASLKYMDKATRALWEQLAQQYGRDISPQAAATFRAFYDQQLKLTAMMAAESVPMLAGSDLGGIWVVPGFSLHQEFRELAAGGLSPLQVLQATTLNGARFLGRQAALGRVAEGHNADLVLLDANPLQDVTHLSRIHAVLLKGRHLDRAALDRMLGDVAEALERQPIRAAGPALDPTHIH